MKKVISLALCVMMLSGLFAINTNALIPVSKNLEYIPVYNVYDAGDFNSNNNAFPTNQNTVANGTSISVIDDGTSNAVMEFAFNGTGAGDGSRLYSLFAIPAAHMSTGWTSYDINNFSIELDVKPICNSSGIGLSLNKATKRIKIYPSVFTEGDWTTVKAVWEYNALAVYAKDRSEDESKYVKLTEGTDYESDKWIISSSQAHIGIDTSSFSNPAKCDSNKLTEAKYYFDNIVVKRGRTYARNIYYTDDTFSFEFDTNIGAAGKSHAIGVVDLPSSSFVMTIDAVRTGGNRPVCVSFGPNNWSNPRSINLLSGEQDVKYTYKVDFLYGSINQVVRKAEGSDVWEVLEKGTDYVEGAPYGKGTFLKFGYLGEYDAAKYCADKPYAEDVNTKWTFSNFQVSCTGLAVAASVKKTETGSVVTVGALEVTTSALGDNNFGVIVAAYDGDVMKAAGILEVEHEASREITFTHNELANPKYKLFFWDTDANSAPMGGDLDITKWVD